MVTPLQHHLDQPVVSVGHQAAQVGHIGDSVEQKAGGGEQQVRLALLSRQGTQEAKDGLVVGDRQRERLVQRRATRRLPAGEPPIVLRGANTRLQPRHPTTAAACRTCSFSHHPIVPHLRPGKETGRPLQEAQNDARAPFRSWHSASSSSSPAVICAHHWRLLGTLPGRLRGEGGPAQTSPAATRTPTRYPPPLSREVPVSVGVQLGVGGVARALTPHVELTGERTIGAA